jgi:hypothetical protein
MFTGASYVIAVGAVLAIAALIREALRGRAQPAAA